MLSSRKKSAETSLEVADATPPPLPASAGGPSTIAGDLVVTGDLKSEGEIRVDGRITGDIECTQLRIGEGGRVHGNVKAKTVLIAGHLEGQIDAGDVVINHTATMIGDVLHDSLTIEQGAHIEGRCARRASKQQMRLPGQDGVVPLDHASRARPAHGPNGAGRPNGHGDLSHGETSEGESAPA